MNIRKHAGLTLALILALTLVLSACGSKDKNENNSASSGETAQHALAGKKIALVMQFNQGTFSAQYVDGVTKQVEKFGGKVTVMASDNDLNKMVSNLDTAINQKFDGILLDHGNADALTNGVNKAVAAGIPVVAFDSGLTVDGVTSLAQNDQLLADKSLAALAKDAGGKGNIVKVWVAGFPPMESRQIKYAEFLKANPDIKEIAQFGDASKAQLDAQTRMEAILKKYPEKGSITAVWAAWDEFAKGVTNAIKQAGRTEIKVYGIDLSDEDLALIQDPTSPWVASAGADPSSIGQVQARYLYQKLNGDKTDATVQIEPVFVSRDSLPTDKKVTTADLGEYVEGWGKSEQGNTDYLKELEQAVGAK
ncbi:sugar ABC transporter substrate-binding protein [Paenibacillus sp. CF384]|uniref:sugar ABC transporter substrate-binding protein n=1 Tax=Paenibacillus sp. CF384 TaxID=1884382 RepID=UPI00089C69C8|nr:sugar ABC transporter substrate-binding protein [Paenibacillus sp. CF384]SDX07481.1 simple sugar transport system substrate-binding protein [Paenibacillus sp. CF384]